MSWLAQASATVAGAGGAAEAAARAKIGTLPTRAGIPREQGAMQAQRFERCVPVAGAYVPETGTPSPFPSGMEL